MTDQTVTDALAERDLAGYFHTDEYVRDVPRSCICPWEWCPPAAAWRRIGQRSCCIWHALNCNGRVPWSAEVQP